MSGVDNFLDDIEFMMGHRPSIYWRCCWGFLTPTALFIILTYFLVNLTPLTYNDEYYPPAANGTIFQMPKVPIIQTQFHIYFPYRFYSRWLEHLGLGSCPISGLDGGANTPAARRLLVSGKQEKAEISK